MADGFLGRWSQRKQALREGRVVEESAVPLSEVAPNPTAPDEPVSPAVPASAQIPCENMPPAAAAKVTAPTLADVQALQADSSFAPFVARDVAPEVRNAAMKKLFADPHYNVMDGLDIYVDDYSLPSPLPAAMLRQMASAQFLKLCDDEEQQAQTLTDPSAPPAIPEPAAPGTSPNQDPHHDHTDLRLQPDPDARPAGLEREPERAADPAFEPVPPPSR